MDSAAERRFLIAGCQRSGTTLLRLALNAHPDISVYDETLGYRLLMGESSEDAAAGETPLTGYKIPRWTDLLPGPTKGDPDQGFHTTWSYGGEPIIFIVRDVHDVVASMDSLEISGQSWLERFGVPLLKYRLRTFPELTSEFEWATGLLADDSVGKFAAGALYWRLKNEALLRFQSLGYPVHPLRYESLARAPEPNLRAVLEFLDCPWHPAVGAHHTVSHGELDEHGLATGKTDPRRAIDSSTIGSGRRNLPAEAINVIDTVVEDLPERLSSAIDEATKEKSRTHKILSVLRSIYTRKSGATNLKT